MQAVVGVPVVWRSKGPRGGRFCVQAVKVFTDTETSVYSEAAVMTDY